MIFSLNTALKPTALKIMYGGKPVSYSGGDIDALHKWIEAMNKRQINANLGLDAARKYPLIWLAEGWVGNEDVPGIKFTNVNFYISINSRIETLNENRLDNFDILYQVGNDFIKELKKFARILEPSISYFERPSFNTTSASTAVEKKSITSDIWDTLIINLDLKITSLKDCF